MSKYSSYKQQQLLTEAWRSFVIVEQQPISSEKQVDSPKPETKEQTPQQKIVSLSKQKITQAGPSQETKKIFSDTAFLNKLAALAKSNPLQAVETILNSLSSSNGDKTNDDAIELSQFVVNFNSKLQSNKTSNLQELMRGKKARPIASAVNAASGFIENSLTKLGNGDIEQGIKKFSGISAFAFLSGVVVTNLLRAKQGDMSALKDAIEQIPNLKASLNLANTGQVAQFFTDVSSNMQNETTEYDNAVLEDGTLVCAGCLEELLESERTIIQEAKYQGRSVTLNKPMKGDVKKFKVYVKDPSTGNVKKVNFGDPNMRIKKSNPARRKSFRARHNCANPGPKTKARFWSCKKW